MKINNFTKPYQHANSFSSSPRLSPSLVFFNAAVLGHSGDVAVVGASLDTGVMPTSVLCRRRHCADVGVVLLSVLY